MRKSMRLLLLGFIMLPLLFSMAHAQSMFNFGSTSNNKTTDKKTSPSASQVQILSPSEFKSTVSGMNQQTKTGLSEELNQQIAAKKSPIAKQELPTPPPQQEITSSTQTPSSVVSPPVPPPPPVSVPSPQPQVVTPVPPAVTTTPSATTTQPGQPQVYSGFAPPQNQTTNQPTPSSGGQQQQPTGWSIKY